jgi:hypothetical protein
MGFGIINICIYKVKVRQEIKAANFDGRKLLTLSVERVDDPKNGLARSAAFGMLEQDD